MVIMWLQLPLVLYFGFDSRRKVSLLEGYSMSSLFDAGFPWGGYIEHLTDSCLHVRREGVIECHRRVPRSARVATAVVMRE